MPARTGFTWPSSEVPAPNGVTATPCWWQSVRMRLTSSVVSTKATASGSVGVVVSSPRLCCSRTLALTLSRSPSRSRSAAMTVSTGVVVRDIGLTPPARAGRSGNGDRRRRR